MKKVLIGSVVLLLLAAGVVMAQQATAPTPTSAAPAVKAPAPAATPTPAASSVAAQGPAAAAPAAAPAPAAKAAAASLTISRMEIAGSIADRQPANIAVTFPASQEKVYCYLELKDIARDQPITFAWTLGQDTDKVTQQVKKSSRWRTWGNKTLAGRKGDWKVEVLDESGAVLRSAAFKVE